MDTTTVPANNGALREILKREERNAAWLGRKIGVSNVHAWRMVRGERPITPDVAQRIGELFGLPAETFIGPGA